MSNVWHWETLPANLSPSELAPALNARLSALDRAFRVNVGTFRAGDATPSVANLDLVTTANTSATNVTTFTQGYAGKTFVLVAGDTHTTLVQGTTLLLTGGANVTLTNGQVKTFGTLDGLVWREIP